MTSKDTKERLRKQREKIREELDVYLAMLRSARVEAAVEQRVGAKRKLEMHCADVDNFNVALRAVDARRTKVHTDEAA